MADKKDFLDQFSTAGKPASFQEEERVAIVKEKKPLNKKVLIIVLVALIILLGLGYFLFLAPKIEMPDFVGQTKTDVAAWVKQQGIETSGIIFDEEYNFDNDKDTVLSQSIKPDTKVKNDVKLTIVLSLGADPDELIRVPDIASMNKSEIKEWISENKLTKTKVNIQYNESVPEEEVIDFAFSGCDEDSFTRSSTLKINVSKGPAPAGKVTVEDFSKKIFEQAETWAKNNKVELVKKEAYSDKIEKGYIISQSIEAGKAMSEGDTLEVTVSLGKAITMADFSTMSLSEIKKWCNKNGLILDVIEHYSSEDIDAIIGQSPEANKIISEDDDIEVIVSKGKLKASMFTGSTKQELKEWIAQINNYGVSYTIGDADYQYSDDVALGNIISISFDGDEVDYVISNGKYVFVDDTYGDLSWNDFYFEAEEIKEGEDAGKYEIISGLTEDEIRKLCDVSQISYEIEYQYSDKVAINYAISIDGLFRGKEFVPQYVGQDRVFKIIICNKYTGHKKFVTQEGMTLEEKGEDD